MFRKNRPGETETVPVENLTETDEAVAGNDETEETRETAGDEETAPAADRPAVFECAAAPARAARPVGVADLSDGEIVELIERAVIGEKITV